jgi:hypothetical protein
VDAITDACFISRFVNARLMARGLLHSPVQLQRYSQGAEDPDSKLVFLTVGRQDFVVTVSPTPFPEIVAQECLKAAQMRSLLGELGTAILEPLDTGRVLTSTYAVLPYRRPLARSRCLRWLDRRRVTGPVLGWLHQLARRHSAACDIARYEAALQALSGTVAADSPTAALAAAAEARLTCGHFAHLSLPMHGDLWKGNVLHGDPPARFTLVDWRGSALQGFPVFDLVRAAQSFGLSPRALRQQLQLHRAALGCQVEDLTVYLLAALGHYAARLGQMRLSLFRVMADDCVTLLSQALAA